ILNLNTGLLLLTIEQEQPKLRILSDSLTTTYEKPINYPPTSITLSPDTIRENAPSGTVVGSFVVRDPNAGDTHRLEIDPADTGLFELKTNTLIVKTPLDFEQAAVVTLSVRAIDPFGLAFTQVIAINVLNTNEPPTDVFLSTYVVPENLPVG